jgi:hypothetical protein
MHPVSETRIAQRRTCHCTHRSTNCAKQGEPHCHGRNVCTARTSSIIRLALGSRSARVTRRFTRSSEGIPMAACNEPRGRWSGGGLWPGRSRPFATSVLHQTLPFGQLVCAPQMLKLARGSDDITCCLHKQQCGLAPARTEGRLAKPSNTNREAAINASEWPKIGKVVNFLPIFEPQGGLLAVLRAMCSLDKLCICDTTGTITSRWCEPVSSA